MLVLLAVAVVAACGGRDDPPPAPPRRAKPLVLTTFHPTTYFARRLAAEDADVALPLPEGVDPVFWQPDAATLRAYQAADLVVVNGAELEKWVLRASLPPSRLVDTARPFRAEWITFEKAVEHRHGPGGLHSHEGIDGHTWLDPVLAKRQAREVARALILLRPARAAAFRERLAALEADLDDLHTRFEAATRGRSDVPLLASHPAYGYLARRYGLRVVNLDVDPALDPEAPPSEASRTAVAARLQETPARVLLWESPPAPAVAEAFRALGLASVVVSPAENPSPADLAAGNDYLAVMRRNAQTLAEALAGR